MDDLATKTHPPLLRVTHNKHLLESGNMYKQVPSANSDQPARALNNIDVGVDIPFASVIELLRWLIIMDIVEKDIAPEDVEKDFNELQEGFKRAVVERGDKVK
ncbi:hypothetical protein FRC09_020606 [Ceratobasidium sp. 395]|nr:hypothetical protein FRC09_020606 [Ceratobasidium sp. 395]